MKMSSATDRRAALMRVLRADSMFHAHVRLSIGTVLLLRPFPLVSDVFNLCFHPVSLVELAGFVVRRVLRRARIEFTLDDGTGLISCTHWDAQDEDDAAAQESLVHVGTFVRVHGKLKLFRGHHNITVYRFVLEERPDTQALVWLQQGAGRALALRRCRPSAKGEHSRNMRHQSLSRSVVSMATLLLVKRNIAFGRE
jgi:hypothetical protein